MQIIDNQVLRLKDFQKKNRLQTQEIADGIGVSVSLLYKLYKNERVPQPDTIDAIKNFINKKSENYLPISTDNYVKERENTYQADTVEIPDFVGENPQHLFLEKLKYLSRIGEMRNSGLLEEDEFLKIKNRLINLL